MSRASNLALPSSLAAVRRRLTQTFRDNGIDTPELDARILVQHALGLNRTELTRQDDRLLTDRETQSLDRLAARRLQHEPVARIVGRKEFWGLPFDLSAATLVPRPETETVVEEALAVIDRKNARNDPLRIADLGTGSGAVLLALLSELPRATGAGTDLGLAAGATARDNATRLLLARRSHFLVCDFGAALAGGFDLVVSNPPYIASVDIPTLPPEVRDHDPVLALDGGMDGLDAYRAICAGARRLLKAGGYLIVELGWGQAEAVAALCVDMGLAPSAPRHDLDGIPRAMAARLP